MKTSDSQKSFLASMLLGAAACAWLCLWFQAVHHYTAQPVAVMGGMALALAFSLPLSARLRPVPGMVLLAGYILSAAGASMVMGNYGVALLSWLFGVAAWPAVLTWTVALIGSLPAFAFLAALTRRQVCGGGQAPYWMGGFLVFSFMASLWPLSSYFLLVATLVLAMAGTLASGAFRSSQNGGLAPGDPEDPLSWVYGAWMGMFVMLSLRMLSLGPATAPVSMMPLTAAALALAALAASPRRLQTLFQISHAGWAAFLLGVSGAIGYAFLEKAVSFSAGLLPYALFLKIIAIPFAAVLVLPLAPLFARMLSGPKPGLPWSLGMAGGCLAGLGMLYLPLNFSFAVPVAAAFLFAFWNDFRTAGRQLRATATAVALLLTASLALVHSWSPMQFGAAMDGGVPYAFTVEKNWPAGEYLYAVGLDYLEQPSILPQARQSGLSERSVRGLGMSMLHLELLFPRLRHVFVVQDHFPDVRGISLAQNMLMDHVDYLCRSSAHPGFAIERGDYESIMANFFAAQKVHLASGPGIFGLMESPESNYDLIVYADAVPWNDPDFYHSVEALRLLKRRLLPEGTVQVRLDSRYWDRPALLRLLRSYAAVFTHVQIWSFDMDQIFLLASDQPVPVTAERFISLLQYHDAINHKAQAFGISSEKTMLAGFLGNENTLNRRLGLEAIPPLSFWNGRFQAYGRSPLSVSAAQPSGPSMFLDGPPLALPIAGLGVTRNAEIAIPAMRLSILPMEGWKLRFAGMEFRTKSIFPPDRTSHYHAILSTPDGRLSIALWEEEPGEAVPLETLADQIALDEKITSGQGEISRHPLRWTLSADSEKRAFTFAWYCDVNNRFFTGKHLDYVSGQADWQVMRERVAKQVACLHLPAGESAP